MIKGFIVGTIICLSLFGISLGITSIVLGITKPGDCNHRDKSGLDISYYLIIVGILIIVTAIVSGILCTTMFYEFEMEPWTTILVWLNLLCVGFGITWFIIGGVILFRSNIDCIQEGSVEVIYALVLWCLSILPMVVACCSAGAIKWVSD